MIYAIKKNNLYLKNKRILDVGFGNGLNIFSFDRSNEVYGIEILPNMVDFANETARRRKYKKYNFQLYKGYGAINYEDGFFDLIVCSHVLEHVPDDHLLLRELYRMLKPGGVCVVLIPGKEEIMEENVHARNYITPDFKKLIESFNFRIISEMRGDKVSDYYRNSLQLDKGDLIGFFRGVIFNVFWSKMPVYLQTYIEDKLLCHEDYSQYLVVVKK